MNILLGKCNPNFISNQSMHRISLTREVDGTDAPLVLPLEDRQRLKGTSIPDMDDWVSSNLPCGYVVLRGVD